MIKYTKNGQPYKILANGKARFIKGKRKVSNSTKSTKRQPKRRRITMAKRKSKSYSRKRKSGLGNQAASIMGAGIYGGFRAKISNVLSPMTSKIPLGNIADEVGLGIAALITKKFLGRKIPLVKDIANAGLLIESARIGEAVATGQIGLGNSAATNGGY